MLKVNEEKLLLDHNELVAKKTENLAVIKRDAKRYAVEHDYDDRQAEKFVAYVVELENSGLTKGEKTKLELLSSYIYEAEEPVAETAESAEVASETDPVLRVGVVNNI